MRVHIVGALGAGLIVLSVMSAQPAIELTGVHLDRVFQMPGANASGLVFAVTIHALTRRASTADFIVVIYDERGRPSGEVTCYAMRFLDGGDRNPAWVRGKSLIEKAGRYELEYVIGPSVTQGALLYGENRPDVARTVVGPFKMPTP